MAWWASAAILVAVIAGSARQPDDLFLYPACQDLAVSLLAGTPRVRAGNRPRFSMTVSNRTNRPARILDVRDGRRRDLQVSYFELVVIQGTRVTDVPIVISDPGPVFPADFFEVPPGGQVEFGQLSYKRMLELLPPGEYEAFVLFWQTPTEPHTTRCRSASAAFTVQE